MQSVAAFHPVLNFLLSKSSSQIFANTAAAGPKQQQLSTIANDTNNTIRSNSRLLSSSSMNTRPNILTDFNPERDISNNI
jgi:hypothetical protein